MNSTTPENNLIDAIAPSALQITSNYVQFGEKFARTFFVITYPRFLTVNWLSPIINLDRVFNVSMFVHPADTGIILKGLRRKLTQIESQITTEQEQGKVRNPVLETARNDIENLRDKLIQGTEKFFKYALYITVFEDSIEKLNEAEEQILSLFEAKMVYIRPALFQQESGINSCLPLGNDELLITNSMNTAPLSTVFPFVSSNLSSNKGILYGINRHNNSLIIFDRFSMENANCCIFGKAGGGKSVKGSEPVLIKNKGKIQLTKIGPLVEKLIRKYGKTKIDKELEGVINPGIEVYSFNKNLKGEWSKVTVAAQKKAPQIFYKFRTASGREITTTGDHNMLILRNGKVAAAKSSEIKSGEFIPLPREVSIKNRKDLKCFNLLELLKNSKRIFILGARDLIKENYRILKDKRVSNLSNDYLTTYKRGVGIPIRLFWKILRCLAISPNDGKLKNLQITHGRKGKGINVYFPINKDFLRLAGFITAEGSVSENSVQISNIDKAVLDSIKHSLKKLGISFYEEKNKKKKRIEGITIKTKVFAEIVESLKGGGRSGQKKVWPFIFNLGKEKIAQYLSAYFEGDGGVNGKDKTVVAGSRSRRLISEIAYLLYYFGIVGRISKIRGKCSTTGWRRNLWIIRISEQKNLNKFAENINFISKRKKEGLSEIIGRESNTNVDFIPGLQHIFKKIHKLFSPQLHQMRQFQDWKNDKRRPSPHQLLKIINTIEEKIQYFKDLSSTFEILSKFPEVISIINSGRNDKNLNKVLWQELGQNWQIMRSQKFKPLSQTALKAINVINGNDYLLTELKEKIHLGFKEMDLPAEYYSRALEPRYLQKNTSYETIQKSAQFVWENYQNILINKIPQVEKKLAQLKVLANSNLFWDPIVEIKKIKNRKDKYVYDLTVDNEVFLAGQGGTFVHNSYAVKLEILRSLMFGINCIVIDPENEYQYLAETTDGAFFKISLTSKHHINPFDISLPGPDETTEQVLRSKIMDLVGLLRIALGKLTPEEDSILDKALTETYASKDITSESDLKNVTPPLLEDLETILENMEGGEKIAKRLQRYTKGSFAGFLNQPTNIDINRNLVVFGIRDMEDELRPVAMYLVMQFIWNLIRGQLKKRIMVVDEAWWMMKHKAGGSFLHGIAKRCRKYWLGLTTITQDVVDFMGSPYGKPIVTNSSIQMLFRQSPATIDVVKKTFNLTDEEKYLLLQSDVGEGIFFAGLKHAAIKVVASYTEDQIVTSSPEQILQIQKAKEELAKNQ